METDRNDLPIEQLELIALHQAKVASRIHSPATGYVLLGLLWAAPIASVAMGFVWGGVALLATVMVTRWWSASITRKTGVKLAVVVPGSKAATFAGWVLLVWLVSAAVAALSGAPFISIIAAGVSAAVTTLLGIKIDQEFMSNIQGSGSA